MCSSCAPVSAAASGPCGPVTRVISSGRRPARGPAACAGPDMQVRHRRLAEAPGRIVADRRRAPATGEIPSYRSGSTGSVRRWEPGATCRPFEPGRTFVLQVSGRNYRSTRLVSRPRPARRRRLPASRLRIDRRGGDIPPRLAALAWTLYTRAVELSYRHSTPKLALAIGPVLPLCD